MSLLTIKILNKKKDKIWIDIDDPIIHELGLVDILKREKTKEIKYLLESLYECRMKADIHCNYTNNKSDIINNIQQIINSLELFNDKRYIMYELDEEGIRIC